MYFLLLLKEKNVVVKILIQLGFKNFLSTAKTVSQKLFLLILLRVCVLL